jgi:4-hydroxy 2-oxovalerate aldolase
MSYSADLDVRVTDSSLRDGSHAIRHQFTVENVRTIVAALDGAGVPVIEVTHGPTRTSSPPRSRPRSRPRSPS